MILCILGKKLKWTAIRVLLSGKWQCWTLESATPVGMISLWLSKGLNVV